MSKNASPVLRPATTRDVPTIEQLLRLRELPTEGVRKHQGGFLVAEEAPLLVGCIGLERYGRIGLLRSLAVEERTAGRGVGTSLVRELLARASRIGIHEVYLLTTTAEDYFPRLGFSVVPRSELPAALDASAELRGACPASAVAMRLRLDPAPD